MARDGKRIGRRKQRAGAGQGKMVAIAIFRPIRQCAEASNSCCVKKLNADSRTEAVARAAQLGLVML